MEFRIVITKADMGGGKHVFDTTFQLTNSQGLVTWRMGGKRNVEQQAMAKVLAEQDAEVYTSLLTAAGVSFQTTFIDN